MLSDYAEHAYSILLEFIFSWCSAAIQVIADITKRMGSGMAKYIKQDVETVADYDEYCHLVAGLVGVGLSQVLQP